MTEQISNKELAKFLVRAHAEMDAGLITNESMADIKFAAERLAAMPDPMPEFAETGNGIIDYLLGSGEFMGKWYGEGPPEGHTGNFWWRQYLKQFIDAMPDVGEQEPTAWLVTNGKTFVDRTFAHKDNAERSAENRNDGAEVVPLYTQPQQPAPDKEAQKNLSLAYKSMNDLTKQFNAVQDARLLLEKELRGLKSSPLNKETIKRYCVKFRNYEPERKEKTYQIFYQTEELFDMWWQQQSADGGE